MGQAGFEPATPGLKDRYSDQLSYWPILMPPPGFEPGSRTNPVLAGYKPAVLPFTPQGQNHYELHLQLPIQQNGDLSIELLALRINTRLKFERGRRDSNPQILRIDNPARYPFTLRPLVRWETGIRTPISRVKVCRPAVRRSPSMRVDGGNRTRDLRSHNPARCRLRYIHHIWQGVRDSNPRFQL